MKRPPVSKSMENERTATTKAKEGRVEKVVVERLKRKKPKRTTNPGGGKPRCESGAVTYLPYTVSPVAIRGANQSTPIIGGMKITYEVIIVSCLVESKTW